MPPQMTSDRDGVTESGKKVPAGTTVTYLGHLPLIGVKVRLPDGSEEVMDTLCFPQLRCDTMSSEAIPHNMDHDHGIPARAARRGEAERSRGR